ncbi:MAG: M67 family metallopeptidase [Chloroflexi bacterium]|nr:M67 family metallopeptidase [Chloroflexota bacterium]
MDPSSAAGPTPPGTRAAPPVAIPTTLRDAIVAAARAAVPEEMCGLVVGSDPPAAGGRALRWVHTRNAVASPYAFEVDPTDLVRVSVEVDERDEALWAIVHSHVASPARPSPTDVRQAFYPDALHLIVSLAASEADPATGGPSLRAWWIVDGAVAEVALAVVP